MPETAEYWNQEVERLNHELYTAKKARDAALIREAQFKVGDVVEARPDGEWVEAIVLRVEPAYGRVEYYVGTRKKDGGWSKRERGTWGAGVRAVGA
jgi:hypothetical protein